jgi:hypothetical protein
MNSSILFTFDKLILQVRQKAKDRQHNVKIKRTKAQTCGTRRVTLVTNLVIIYIGLHSLYLAFPLVILCASHLIGWILSVSECILSLPNLDFTTSNI